MNAKIYYLSVPMKATFGHAAANRSTSETILFSLDHRGVSGLGECIPRKYVTGETIDSVIHELMLLQLNEMMEAIDLSSLKNALSSWSNISVFNENCQHFHPSVVCVIEMAVLDFLAKYFNCTLKDLIKDHYIPKDMQSTDQVTWYKTTQTMDFSWDPKEFTKARRPFHHIKIKAGKDFNEDLHRVKIVRDAVGADVPISVDANMSWNMNEAIHFIESLRQYNIGFYEEPLNRGNFLGYKKLKDITDAKILLDESLCNKKDATIALQTQCCDAFNIRISKCGGILNSIDFIKIAHQNKLDFQIGALVAETGPLIAASRHLIGAISGYFAYEAGQPERFFGQENYLVTPMPFVNRQTNLAAAINEIGLGINLSKNFTHYLKKQFVWSNGKWQLV